MQRCEIVFLTCIDKLLLLFLDLSIKLFCYLGLALNPNRFFLLPLFLCFLSVIDSDWDFFSVLAQNFLFLLMLDEVLHHLKIILKNGIVYRHHSFLILGVLAVLLEVLMREALRILQQQVFKNFLVTVHGRDVTCVLSRLIRCGEFQILAAHEHLHHDDAGKTHWLAMRGKMKGNVRLTCLGKQQDEKD